MAITLRFHEIEDQCNILKTPTEKIAQFFETHPTAYKITLIFNHLFRAAMMVGFMLIPNMPLYVSMPICFVGSLFYRLTVEKNCAYKFALPSFVGSAVFMLALPAFISMINGVGFSSFAIGLKNCASLLPLALYGAYILLSVNYDVNKKQMALEKKPEDCCSKTETPPKTPLPMEECHCQTQN